MSLVESSRQRALPAALSGRDIPGSN